jgi:hypothetical protein
MKENEIGTSTLFQDVGKINHGFLRFRDRLAQIFRKGQREEDSYREAERGKDKRS